MPWIRSERRSGSRCLLSPEGTIERRYYTRLHRTFCWSSTGDTEKIATTNGLRLTRLAVEQTHRARPFLPVGVPAFSLTLYTIKSRARPTRVGPRVRVRGRCFLRVAGFLHGNASLPPRSQVHRGLIKPHRWFSAMRVGAAWRGAARLAHTDNIRDN